MNKNLFFSMIIAMAFLILTTGQSYAKMDVLREVDDIVDASKPNVLLIVGTDSFMNRPIDGSGGVNQNTGDDPSTLTGNSRFYNVKDVLSGLTPGEEGVLQVTKDVINYGLMTYSQTGYYPYYTTDCLNALLQRTNENPTTFAYQYDTWSMFKSLFAFLTTPSLAYACHQGHDHGQSICPPSDPDDVDDPCEDPADCVAGACSGAADISTTAFEGKSFVVDRPGPPAHALDGDTVYYFNFTSAPFTQYPIDDDQTGGGNLLVEIDPAGILDTVAPVKNWTAGPGTTTYPLEVDAIEAYLQLQNDGGIAMDKMSSSDDRVPEVFKKVDAADPSDPSDPGNLNDAYEYFKNVVIPGDDASKNGCFTKNYIIYLADAFVSAALATTTAGHAEELFNLNDGAATPIKTPVKTFVIGVIDPSSHGQGSERGRLNEIARKGGTDASEPIAYGLQRTTIPTTPSCSSTEAIGACSVGNDYAFFVANKADLKQALLDIAAVIAAGDFVTGAPSASSSGSTFVTNDVGILASSEYPSWRGHLRGVDLINDQFWWDAGTELFIGDLIDSEGDLIDNRFPKAYHLAALGDGTTSPANTQTVGGDVYQYTNTSLYCKKISDGAATPTWTTNTVCNSSDLASYKWKGKTVTFGTDEYEFVGAFYLPPWQNRKIYTSQVNGDLLPFTTANAATLKAMGAGWRDDSNVIVTAPVAEAIINFTRGGVDEDADGTIDYPREWLLGDITNVVPVAVGRPIEPKDSISGRNGYQSDFSYRDDNPVVYTGSNDGMLHAFNFRTGEEVFTYIPPDLLPQIKTVYDHAMESEDPMSFTGQEQNPSDHTYGVATSSKVTDVQFADGTWHTVLMSGEGPGGQNYFALDVTHPYGTADFNGTAAEFAAAKRYNTTVATGGAPFSILWHTEEDNTATNNLAASYGSTLGETWSVPAFARVYDGIAGAYKWVVFVGSGYDDTNAAANYRLGGGDGKGEVHHIINIEDGVLLKSNDIDAVAPLVQYGLLSDSVTIIKKTGSKVRAGYQFDLEGNVNHISTIDITDPANWTKTPLTPTFDWVASGYDPPTSSTPFYYSPSIWDFDSNIDDAKNLLVFGSGAYDDEQQDDIPSIGSPDSDRLFFMITSPGGPIITDAISIDLSAVSGDRVDGSGNYIDSDGNILAAAAKETQFVSADSRLLASPVLFKNTTSNHLEALFLVFDPPAASDLGCSFGGSYLLVFNLGAYSKYEGNAADTFSGAEMAAVAAGTAHAVVKVGSGKVSGISMAGGASHAVVGQSGRGYGSTSGFSIAGSDTWSPVGDTTKLYWKAN